jgi:hypothetical protein
MSVSQAVRREVAAVGDGIERAVARAGELETLVRSEISTLERAYSDNEIRMRSLVDELITQREAIVTNAERVRTAIAGSHQSLAHELDIAADRMTEVGRHRRVTASPARSESAARPWRSRSGRRASASSTNWPRAPPTSSRACRARARASRPTSPMRACASATTSRKRPRT